jgi:hypothetical protein
MEQPASSDDARPAPKTILVADVASGQDTIRNIVGNDAAVMGASTLQSAMRRIEAGEPQLVICGIHFDESRMFDLLQAANATAQGRLLPFLCFREIESELPPALFQGMEMSCRAMGAAGFVDLHHLKQLYGVEEADRTFRDIIFACLVGLKPELEKLLAAARARSAAQEA